MEVKQQSSPWAAAVPALLSFFAILALILDAETAVSAASAGLQLCLQTVVPSLFPFLVAARLFTSSGAVEWCARVVGPVMGPAFGLPPQGAAALVLGLLGGYPVGAQTAATLYGERLLTKAEAERLLAFCSNAGPAFIFGMVGGLFGSGKIAAVLFGIHIVSALLTGLIFRPRGNQVLASSGNTIRKPASKLDFSAVMTGAVKTMGLICGCIVLFQVIVAFLERALGTWMPPAVEIGLSGLLELAGGCSRLPQLEAAGLRYCMASGFLAFGGLCVWLQTKSVIAPYGLTGRYYLSGKVLQGTIAVLLTWGIQVVYPSWLPRTLPTAAFPNHAGLLRATAIVTALFLCGLGIWCLRLRKKAGKEEALDVY